VAVATPVPEYSLKAAFIYNLINFTEWPPKLPGNSTICVIGKDPFGPAMDALQGKLIRGLPVTVRRLQMTESTHSCRVLFIGETGPEELRRLLDSLQGRPILTVADGEEPVHQGVMVGLLIENNRLTYEFNTDATKRAGLVISSKLLRLAREVH